MARPIKETPVLTGKDARRFENEIKRNASEKIPKSEYEKAVENYKRFVVR